MRRQKLFIVFILILVLFSCTEKYMIVTKPEIEPPVRVLDRRPGVALALSGGAFHGAAHAGVLKALEENNISVDFIAGTSAGSLVGALYCDNPHADSLIPLVLSTKSSTVFDFSLIRSKVGFVSGKKLQGYVNEHCTARNIEDTQIPFVAVATDLLEGKSVYFSSGPLAPAINASCAIPGMFEPVKMYGMTLVDGGVLNNIPTNICRAYHADVVIAVDIMADIDSMESIDTFLKILYKSLILATQAGKKHQLDQADIVITPNLKDMPMMSSRMNRQIYDSGYIAALRMIPEIKRVVGKQVKRK